jgi:hypothetical protein
MMPASAALAERRLKQRYFFLPLPFFADASAMTRPADEWPLRSSLEASLNSRFVGGFIAVAPTREG